MVGVSHTKAGGGVGGAPFLEEFWCFWVKVCPTIGANGVLCFFLWVTMECYVRMNVMYLKISIEIDRKKDVDNKLQHKNKD